MPGAPSAAEALLRPGLLEGAAMLVAGLDGSTAGEQRREPLAGDETDGPRQGMGERVAEECRRLGARVMECDERVEPALSDLGGVVDVLVLDGAGMFTRAERQDGARAALRACLAQSWEITHAVVNRAFLPGERGGRVVYVTPPVGDPRQALAGHAYAARAGLENLARTLSIEWARRGVTTVTIVPGTSGEVAALTAYLASPAGAYFSGALLDLSGPRAQASRDR